MLKRKKNKFNISMMHSCRWPNALKTTLLLLAITQFFVFSGSQSVQAQNSNISIRVNQVGYFTGRPKIISVNSASTFSGLNYTVTDANGMTMASGSTTTARIWPDAQEFATTIDVSEIDTPGEYTIDVDGSKVNFTVGNKVYDDLAQAVFKYYYFNRASMGVTAEFGGQWQRAAGHPDQTVRIHSSAASTQRPTGTIISAPKGWYDAGDYNKYIVNSGISTYTLLAAYEDFTSYYKGREFNIPESGNTMPDILDEITWNLDWMLDMQDPNDGGVYHKLTGLNFSGIVMPADYNLDRYVVAKSTAAALDFAAVMAMAARVFKDFSTERPGYSDEMVLAAERAYSWAEANPTEYFNNPSDVSTGEYGDGNVSDEFQWAATELFITTGKQKYRSAINISAIPSGVSSWGSVGSLALFSLDRHANNLPSALNVRAATTKLVTTADEIKNRINSSSMRIGMSNSNYVWGSNSVAANQVMYLIKVFQSTRDESYLDAAYIGMDYLLGRNGLDISFVTGYGDRFTENPHHRVSEADAIDQAVPGMLAGGPQPGQQDGCNYASNQPAKSYVDDWCSFASNEITINWNAPMVYTINALQHYENLRIAIENGVLSTSPIKDDVYLSVFPNPAVDEVNITSEVSLAIVSIDIYDLNGDHIKSYSYNNAPIDVNGLNAGLYLLKVNTKDAAFFRKFKKQ